VDPLLLPIEEAARLLSIGRTKMYELIGQGLIPAVHIGTAVRAPTEDVRGFVQAQLAESSAMLPAPTQKALGVASKSASA